MEGQSPAVERAKTILREVSDITCGHAGFYGKDVEDKLMDCYRRAIEQVGADRIKAVYNEDDMKGIRTPQNEWILDQVIKESAPAEVSAAESSMAA